MKRTIRSTTVVIALAIAMVFSSTTAASAAVVGVFAATPAVSFTLPSVPDFLGLVITVVLPLVVGIVTKREFQHKALVLLALTAANGFLVELANTLATGGSYEILQGLLNWLISFGLAVLLHYGFLKPEGITEKVQQYGPQ